MTTDKDKPADKTAGQPPQPIRWTERDRTMSRARPLGDFVPALTKDVFGRKNMLFGKMLAAWGDIAGPDIAALTIPTDLKMARGTDKKQAQQAVLHLLVQPAFALEFSYQKNLLIERLNAFFGYAAIKDIKVVQNSEVMTKKALAPVKRRPLALAQSQKLEEMTQAIEEKDLQTALKNLGKAILSRMEEPSSS